MGVWVMSEEKTDLNWWWKVFGAGVAFAILEALASAHIWRAVALAAVTIAVGATVASWAVKKQYEGLLTLEQQDFKDIMNELRRVLPSNVRWNRSSRCLIDAKTQARLPDWPGMQDEKDNPNDSSTTT